jgi:phosphoserine phosphatase RsbU/P
VNRLHPPEVSGRGLPFFTGNDKSARCRPPAMEHERRYPGKDNGDDMPLEISELKESNDFLNTLLDQITSAVFIADEHMRIHSVNNALQTLFFTEEDQILGQLLGNAIGCAFAVMEGTVCGTTSHCDQCQLRHSLFKSFTDKVPTYHEKIKREFYIHNEPVLKYLQFSTKYIKYHGEEMVLIIVDDITETETQRIRLYEDLQAAAEIQRSLLPSAAEAIDSLEVAWQFLPCQQIGGDIFNLVQLDRDHWGIYMLDVSGHGVPSAMMVVSITQLLQPYAGYLIKHSTHSASKKGIVAPGEVLQALDREYPIERFNNYFTIAYLVLNTKTGHLRYCSAGHPKPVIVRADGRLEELEEGGTVIGMDGIVPFQEGHRTLDTGDRLFVYTDGITEYENDSEEFYGKDRFYRELQRLKDHSLDVMVRELIGSLKRFGNHREPQDDISLLGLQFQ